MVRVRVLVSFVVLFVTHEYVCAMWCCMFAWHVCRRVQECNIMCVCGIVDGGIVGVVYWPERKREESFNVWRCRWVELAELHVPDILVCFVSSWVVGNVCCPPKKKSLQSLHSGLSRGH